MLHLTLLPALAAPALAPLHSPSLQDELSKALPRDAAMVALFGDLHAACNGADAGRWAKMLGDPRWQELALQLAAASDPEADVDGMSRAIALGLESMRGAHGAALASLDPDSRRTVGVLKVDEGWLAATIARIGEGGEAFEPVDALGGKAYFGGETGGMSTLVVERGGHVVLASDVDLEAAMASAGGVLAGLAAPATDEQPWWLAAANRAPGAEIELFLDGEKLAEDEPELQEMTGTLGALEVIYMALDLGAENAAEVRLALQVGGGPIMDSIAGVFGKAEPLLLKHAPSGYTGSVLGLDVEALIEAALAMSPSEPGADPAAAYEEGLGAINGMLGVDLQADLIDQLTGQVLVLQPETDFEAIVAAQESGEVPMDALMPTVAFAVADGDAVLGVVEALVGVVESQGLLVETADISGSQVWMTDPGMGFTVAFAVGRGFLALGAEDGVAALASALAKPEQEHAVPAATIQAFAPELDGAMVTLAPLAAVFAAIESFADVAGELNEGEGEELDALAIDTLRAALAIAREHLAGVMAGELQLTPTGMTYRVFTR